MIVHFVHGKAEGGGMWERADMDAAGRVALVGIKLCFNRYGKDKLHRRIDSVGGRDGWKAMVAAVISGGGWRKVDFMVPVSLVVLVRVRVRFVCLGRHAGHVRWL